MTIHEIESTLDSLRARHPDLDERMLTTLLLAAGWDDRTRNDALAIYRGNVRQEPIQKKVELPAIQIEPVLVPPVEVDHMLLAHNPEVEEKTEAVHVVSSVLPTVLVEEKPTIEYVTTPERPVEVLHHSEPEIESLIVPAEITVSRKEIVEPPHNLPLRPFETTPHIWSFSRYKDVFHGNDVPEETKNIEPVVVKKSFPVFTPSSPTVSLSHSSKPQKDESLVLLATSCLMLVLGLLWYMYSNGRL